MYNRYFFAISTVKCFTIRVPSLMIHLFRCHLVSSSFTFLPRLPHMHNKIDLVSGKDIFPRNQDIVMQYSCFCFSVIISANTE